MGHIAAARLVGCLPKPGGLLLLPAPGQRLQEEGDGGEQVAHPGQVEGAVVRLGVVIQEPCRGTVRADTGQGERRRPTLTQRRKGERRRPTLTQRRQGERRRPTLTQRRQGERRRPTLTQRRQGERRRPTLTQRRQGERRLSLNEGDKVRGGGPL